MIIFYICPSNTITVIVVKSLFRLAIVHAFKLTFLTRNGYKTTISRSTSWFPDEKKHPCRNWGLQWCWDRKEMTDPAPSNRSNHPRLNEKCKRQHYRIEARNKTDAEKPIVKYGRFQLYRLYENTSQPLCLIRLSKRKVWYTLQM